MNRPIRFPIRFPLAVGGYAAVAALVLQTPAQAHNAASTGAMAGVLHALFGLDHLLMLLAVGVAGAFLSASLLLWALAGGVVGALLGSAGLQLPGLEFLASAAVLLVGGWTVAARHLSGRGWLDASAIQWIGGGLVAVAVSVHGLLHGLEAPRVAGSLAWWAGSLLISVAISGGTALLLRRLQVASNLSSIPQGARRPSR